MSAASVVRPVYDDPGTAAQCLDHRLRTDVGIGRDDAAPHFVVGPLAVEMGKAGAVFLELLQARQEIVTRDDADRKIDTDLAAQRFDRVGAGARMNAAGVGDYGDPLFRDQGERAAQVINEVVGKSTLGIARSLPLQDHHGDLRQVVEGHVVEWPAGDLAIERLRVIAPIAARVGDPHDILHGR